MMLQRPKYKSFPLKAGPHKINNKSVAVTTCPHCTGLFLTSISSGGSRGRAWGGPPPLFFDQNEAQLAKNNFFGDRPPPLSQGLDDRAFPLSEGLDSPLISHKQIGHQV